MPVELNINSTDLVKFTNRLEGLSSTAMPNVVRRTLNDTALDVKKRTLPQQAKQSFEERDSRFFKRFSRVDFAKGNQLSKLQATVGMMQGAKGKDAIDNLEKQETGGSIGGRTYIPTDKARVGGSRGRKVRAKNRLQKVKHSGAKIIKTSDQSGVSWAQRAIKASVLAGVGGYVEDWRNGRGGLIWRVDSLNRNGAKRFTRTDIFYINKGGRINVKGKHTAQKAATEAYKKLGSTFLFYAEKRLKQSLK